MAGATVLACLLAAGTAAAATYEPTRKDDPTPGQCKPNDCSLREALKAANVAANPDTILLGKGTYEMAIPGVGSNFGSFDIVYETTIRGSGKSATTIDANGLDAVVSVWGNFQDGETMKLDSLTLTGGDAGPSPAALGGAINANDEDPLILSRTRLTDNSAGGAGGALFASNSPKVTVTRSVISGNHAPNGGGIAAFGTTSMTVTRSKISENTADFGGGIASTASELLVKKSTVASNTGGEGGGFDLRPTAALPVTRISSSTIFDNTATNKGGAMLADGLPHGGPDLAEDPEVHITNSTIASNQANNDGGGVIGDNLATVEIDSSSIGFNQANADNTGTAVGGGILQHGNASFSVDDSVLVSNGDSQISGGDDDCSATEVFSGSGNVITATTGCIVSFTEPFNKYEFATPIAEQPADNGGPTDTMKVPGSSVAVGFANNCPNRDQRGEKRPANNCDSGAYENKPVG